MKTLNYSKQRQAIMNFLCTRTDHPTVEVIYKHVKEVQPRISMGTVYRNLNLLADMGYIKRIKGNSSAEHYDGNTAPHQHFVCTSCGAVEDIFLDDLSAVTALEQQAHDINSGVRSSDIYFHGICSGCRESAT